MSVQGQNPNASRTLVCQLPPAADIRRIGSGPLRAITGREQMQQTTHASASLFDHLVAALLERRYLKLIKSVRLSVEALGFKGSFVAFALF